MGRFEGQVVFITGASAGIGAAVARRFAAVGADVALVARRKDRLESLAATICKLGRRALVLEADVTRDGDLEAAAETARKAFGRIDVLVANAGYGVVGAFDKLKLDDYRRQFETNFYGVLRAVHATLPDIERVRGRIAIVGSVAGYLSTPGTTAYSVSKAAVHSLAQGMRLEFAGKGVSVTLIVPGFVESEIRLLDNQGVLKTGAADPVPRWLVMPTDRAAREIVGAIARRDPERVITGHGKIAVFLQRHTPSLISAAVGLGARRRRELRWDEVPGQS
jgi:short-subunit dehydrogenase